MSDEAKDVEFYAANLNAWLNTRFELDKSLLTLSAGGIGVLVSLLSDAGIKSIESLILYFLALLSFITCLFSLLFIFQRNAKHLEDVVCNRAQNDSLLKILDRVSATSFIFGVVFSSIIGASIAVNTYLEKEKAMSRDKETPSTETVKVKVEPVLPSRNDRMSVDGITNMRPSPPTQTTQPAPEPSKDSGKK